VTPTQGDLTVGGARELILYLIFYFLFILNPNPNPLLGGLKVRAELVAVFVVVARHVKVKGEKVTPATITLENVVVLSERCESPKKLVVLPNKGARVYPVAEHDICRRIA
jgi:hypothetical protein